MRITNWLFLNRRTLPDPQFQKSIQRGIGKKRTTMNPLTHFKKISILSLLLLVLLSSPSNRTFAQSAPLDLWSSNTQLRIRDRSTLNYSITARTGYFEVYFDSNNNATWAHAVAPYAIHTGGKIRIHG